MKIKLLLVVFLTFLLLPTALFAQDNLESKNEVMFKAQVIEIIEHKINTDDSGLVFIKQKLKLKGLEGEWKNKEIIFDGTKYDVISSPEYKVRDKVLVSYSQDIEGNDNFYVIGFVRQGLLSIRGIWARF